MQKEGYNGLTGLERGKPWKKTEEKRQKIENEPCPIWREKKNLKTLLKSKFERSNFDLKKKNTNSLVSIDRKSVSVDQNRQGLL